MDYEAVIGLEVHVQLKTKTKAFCGCSTEFGKNPNSQICPVCLGFPGSLPVLNKTSLDYALRVALALNCTVQGYTKFDRKNYFYPDLPKNYQISQYDLPLAIDGFLDIEPKSIKIKRVHLEEDAGKLMHAQAASRVDFNRAGIPLLEVVTHPDINSPQEAHEYLATLKTLIEYLEVSDCDMEKGSLRCDANISIRKKGVAELGTKTEIKNLNSFKSVKDALAFEIDRQVVALSAGTQIVQETRLWDAKELKTVSMRTKEEAKDYRYFPEPDLPPFLISDDKIAEIKKTIPQLPHEVIERFMKEYGLLKFESKILASRKPDAQYCEECIRLYGNKDKKPIVNWLIGPLLSEANLRNCLLPDLKVSPKELVELVNIVERAEVSNLSGKTVLKEMIENGKPAQEIIREKNLAQISDAKELESKAEEAIKENLASVEDYKKGKANALMFLVGQVMKKTQGKANPKIAQEVLKRRLNDA